MNHDLYSFLDSPAYGDMRIKHEMLFIYLLKRVTHNSCVCHHNGHEIQLKPGQLCISFRQFVEDYNQTRKHKQDKIDISFLQRALELFDRLSLAIHEAVHNISVITITYPIFYEYLECEKSSQEGCRLI